MGENAAKVFIQALSSSDVILSKEIDEVVETNSNLNLSVLKEISFYTGIDIKGFILEKKFIDFKLVKTRNEIAHGEGNCVTKEEFLLLYERVRDLITKFKELIISTAENYNKQSSSSNEGTYFSCMQ